MKKNSKKQRKTSNRGTIFTIGTKLIIIITIIVLFSLGAIIALVSWLVREDLRIAAEDSNFEANRRSALEAESSLANIRSNSLILVRTVTAVGTESALARESEKFFFDQNPQVAAVFFTDGARTDSLLINDHFFTSREIDASLAASYRNDNRMNLRRAAAGETILLNAAPHFAVSMLAMFFPWPNGGGGVLFYPENMNNTFTYGTNQSWLINRDGDILVHADFEMVLAGMNVADQDFIRIIQDSPDRNKQMLIETDFGVVRFETKKNFILLQWERYVLPQWKNLKQHMRPLIAAALDFLRIDVKMADLTGDGEAKMRHFVAFTRLNTGDVVITNIEYDKVFEGINATTRRNGYLTAAVLSLSIIVIWFFSKSISIPLKALAAAAHTIEGGNFQVELYPKGRDEIGILTASFLGMCNALGIFGRFTNRDIALRAIRGEIKPGGFPKKATVFFSDIRDFTAKSEAFTRAFGNKASDRIVQWLNNYFTQMIECVERTSGVVDKFIGDAVMAHWGTAYTAGTPQKDAYNCVKAALMMRKALYLMNRNRPPNDPGNPSIRIGCGINSGVVTAGQLGSERRMEYTVIGDPVNLASRVEALNKPLGTDILITEDTWRLVRDKFITEEMPSVTVKGKKKPVRIFAVINYTRSRKGPRTLAEVRRKLGITPPDISKVDINADEKKYAIGEKG